MRASKIVVEKMQIIAMHNEKSNSSIHIIQKQRVEGIGVGKLRDSLQRIRLCSWLGKSKLYVAGHQKR